MSSLYKQVKKALKASGELMIQMADGKTFELHIHNTTFDDASSLIELDAAIEKYWLDGNQVIYMWIHRAKD